MVHGWLNPHRVPTLDEAEGKAQASRTQRSRDNQDKRLNRSSTDAQPSALQLTRSRTYIEKLSLKDISAKLRVLTSLAYLHQTLNLCMHFLFRPIEIDLGQSASAFLNILPLQHLLTLRSKPRSSKPRIRNAVFLTTCR